MLPAALAAILISACAPKRDVDELQNRVRFQDQQLQQMQPAQADTWAQLQAIRRELAILRGQMDDQQNKVNKHDAALRQVESALAMNFQLDAPGAALSPPPAAPAGEGPSGLLATPGAAVVPGAAIAPSVPATAPAPAAPAPAVAKDAPTALYDNAMASYNARNYQESLRAFTEFTKTYPNHKLTSAAWFHVGESNFQLNQFGPAALAYDTVITKYGSSPRAPAAYMKQALSFGKLGQKAAADERLKELIRKFPNSPEAARAKQIAQQIK